MQDSQEETLKKRKEVFLNKLKSNQSLIAYIIFAVIAYLGYKIRVSNLGYLTDVTTGKYIPIALDPFAFLRYVEYIFENGKLMAFDTMRYYPFGYSQLDEFGFLSYLIVYMYKFLHFFMPALTIQEVHVLYPPICFVIGLLFFFLFVRKVFDWRIGLLSTAFLAFIPAYLYRTMAGFSDKESAAMMFLFMALFFFVMYIKEKKLTYKLLYAALAGTGIGFMGIIWGGVSSLFLIIGSFVLIAIFLNKFEEKDFYGYSLLIIIMLLVLKVGYPSKYGLLNLLGSYTSGLMFIALIVALINYIIFQKNLLKIKDKIPYKLPAGLTSLIITIVIALIYGFLVDGKSFLIDKITGIWSTFITEAGSRWILTVAESHQPYFQDVISQFGQVYLILVFIGAILLFYELVKNVKEKYYLTAGFATFILLFTFSRYSAASPILNGTSTQSLVMYGGSLAVFILGLAYYYIYKYYKDKDTFEKFHKFDRTLILILVVFFFLLVGARTAARLIFLFAPITTILMGYTIFYAIDKAQKVKDKVIMATIIIAVVILAGYLLYDNYQLTEGQAQYTGPSYNQQWQVAMQWVRDNTAEDSVFAHWWDYGYWVTYGGERATIADGGNAVGVLNYYIGRHILLGETETEALEYMKAREATHLLIISDEIGKYGAYSSIGSDENYDRYSWIPNFNLDLNQIQETRNGTVVAYTGGAALDEDFIFQDKIFPAGSAGVVGVTMSLNIDENKTLQSIDNPIAVIVYQGQQYGVPLRCVYFEKKEYIFEGDDEYLEGCLMIIPTIDGNGVNGIGSSLYLSPRVMRGLFAQLYLLERNEEFPHFNLVYNDESTMPLSLYQGRLIGPLKIWEVSYPNNLDVPEEYYLPYLVNMNVTIV